MSTAGVYIVVRVKWPTSLKPGWGGADLCFTFSSVYYLPRDCLRYQIPLKFHPNHPLRSVDGKIASLDLAPKGPANSPLIAAGRMLCAFPAAYRSQLAHILFRGYWYDSANLNSRQTLLRLARSLRLTSIASTAHNGPFSLDPILAFKLDDSLFEDATWADALRANTQEAFERGAFGVPSFWVEKTQRLYFGQDRLHLLEAALISVRLDCKCHWSVDLTLTSHLGSTIDQNLETYFRHTST